MLITAFKPGHDGSVAAIEDGRLLLSLEAEKDSSRRYCAATPTTLLDAAEYIGRPPDVIATGGWNTPDLPPHRSIGAGYLGIEPGVLGSASFCGRKVTTFTSSHERSHILMAVGMAPPANSRQAVLVWEGVIGAFYLLDVDCSVIARIPVLDHPGIRYAFLFHLADPKAKLSRGIPHPEGAGKLMALSAFGDAEDAGSAVRDTVERILAIDGWGPRTKHALADSPVFNAGVQAQVTRDAAALLTQVIFERYRAAALEHLPPGLPLRISGGCGLNCGWNLAWRELGFFSSVDVPPCTNDSGSAIGTAIDAQLTLTGHPYVEWDVYAGVDFVEDAIPDPAMWIRRPMDPRRVAAALAEGRVVAWVQGRSEIGPRALGNRSLLAEPSRPASRDRLNEIKQREDYRPIAPCVRIEEAGKLFDDDFPDPHMLYFRRVTGAGLAAVTHVDGTARVQTVSAEQNPMLHELLTQMSNLTGTGALCNTSLNFKGFGFINRMSDLSVYCEQRGVDDFVVGQQWFTRRLPSPHGQ